MTKSKAFIITGIASVLLFCVLYLSSSYDIHWYNTFQSIFATYGYIQAMVILYKWLRVPSYESDPKHVDLNVASGKTIPDSWLNPFKIVKENDNGQTVAKADGLSNAGHYPNRRISVPCRAVETERTGYGGGSEDASSENGPAPCQSES